MLLEPLFAFGLVGTDVNVVDEHTQVPHLVQVLEDLRHVVLQLLRVRVLQLEFLLEHIAYAVDCRLHVVVVQERSSRVITGKLQKKDHVSFVLFGGEVRVVSHGDCARLALACLLLLSTLVLE